MALRILLVGNYGQDQQHSMLGFGRALFSGLCDLGHQVELSAPRRRIRRPNTRFDKWFAYADKYVLYPRELRKRAANYDLVHILDQGNGIYVQQLQRQRHLVTCHDLLAIRAARGELDYWQIGPSGQAYQRAILSGLQRAKWVAAVSSATRNDALRLLKLPEARVPLIKNGLYGHWAPQSGAASDPRVAELHPHRYLLHVGSDDPYKNRIAALPIFAAMRNQCDHLVLAGRPPSLEVLEQARRLGLGSALVTVSDISPELLAWLYTNALGLLVTSHDEGFGLPILEAQACGCPVIIPNKEPMTEVAGPAGIRIDPGNPESAAHAVRLAMQERAQRSAAGIANAAAHSTEQMVQAYAELYNAVMSE